MILLYFLPPSFTNHSSPHSGFCDFRPPIPLPLWRNRCRRFSKTCPYFIGRDKLSEEFSAKRNWGSKTMPWNRKKVAKIQAETLGHTEPGMNSPQSLRNRWCFNGKGHSANDAWLFSPPFIMRVRREENPFGCVRVRGFTSYLLTNCISVILHHSFKLKHYHLWLHLPAPARQDRSDWAS